VQTLRETALNKPRRDMFPPYVIQPQFTYGTVECQARCRAFARIGISRNAKTAMSR
jgi:hypothetical protein